VLRGAQQQLKQRVSAVPAAALRRAGRATPHCPLTMTKSHVRVCDVA